MPRLIQTPPTGLLDTLTSKDGGIGPSALLDEVRAVVDILPYYGLNFRRSRQRFWDVATINANGGEGWNYASLLVPGGVSADLVIPDGQLWHILGLSLKVETITGNQNAMVGWSFRPRTGGAPAEGIPVGSNTGNVAVGSDATCGGLVDFWAPAGGCFAFFIRDWAVGVNDGQYLGSIDYEVFTV